MGGSSLAAISVLCLVLAAACGGDAQAAVHEDVLVLEVGGSQASLREALAARGIVLAPPHRVRADLPVRPSLPVPSGPVQPQPAAPSPKQHDEPVTPRVAPPAATYKTVRLGRHQTLIHLSKEHLGDGNRFREIMALNGWTDADARRLPEGQLVKIPIDRAR